MKMKIIIITCVSLFVWSQFGFSEVLDRQTIVVSPSRISTEKVFVKTEAPKAQISEIYFKTGSSKITKSQMQKLNKLSISGGEVLVISGHSSSTGTKKQNLKLSAKRALVVKKVLQKKYPNLKFELYHYGAKNPKYTNKTIRGRNGNQRVVVKVQFN